jgi:NADH-quinone oxidoreductase subunit E
MAVFAGTVMDEARSIIERYPQGRQRSAVMPLLYLAQSEQGHVTREALQEIGVLLDITTAEVEAVATFYTMFRMLPTGRHLVTVCTNLSCMLRGAKQVYAAAVEAAGVSEGAEVSEDGAFSVHEEECLGVCDFAPAVQVDFANHDAVTPERVRALIARLRAGEIPTPARGPAMEDFRHASRVLAGLGEIASTGGAVGQVGAS